MKTERIVLSFIAVVVGILCAALIFYLYQSTKTIPDSQTKPITLRTTDQPTLPPTKSSIYLVVDHPKDEEVTDKKTVTVSGKTLPNAVVIITTSIFDEVVTPALNGDFTTTVSIEDDTNQIVITAIAQNGEETKVIKTITYSTESF